MGTVAALLGLAVLLVSAVGLAAIPETMEDERLYAQAAACQSSTVTPTENCLHARAARVAGTAIRDEPKYGEFTLRLRKVPGLPEEIDMGSAGPLLEHLTPGDQVTITLSLTAAIPAAVLLHRRNRVYERPYEAEARDENIDGIPDTYQTATADGSR